MAPSTRPLTSWSARAGANTVAELAVVGVPAILVPLPGAPGDHQTRQRRGPRRAGAAVVLADPECTAPRLAQEIDALARRPGRLAAMGAAARRVGRPDAVTAVVGAGPSPSPGPVVTVIGHLMSAEAEALDLSRPRRVHVVGAGGAGMSAIASVLAAMGHIVTGSDLKTSLSPRAPGRQRRRGLRGA